MRLHVRMRLRRVLPIYIGTRSKGIGFEYWHLFILLPRYIRVHKMNNTLQLFNKMSVVLENVKAYYILNIQAGQPRVACYCVYF